MEFDLIEGIIIYKTNGRKTIPGRFQPDGYKLYSAVIFPDIWCICNLNGLDE